MKKLIIISALTLSGLFVKAQSNQHRSLHKVRVGCTVHGNLVTFTPAQLDSVSMYSKQGYHSFEVITINGKSVFILAK